MEHDDRSRVQRRSPRNRRGTAHCTRKQRGRTSVSRFRGTDLGLSLRTATKGFVLGDWGAALDLGGYDRLWEGGSLGGQGSLVLGAPWGITLSLSGGMGTNDERHASAVIGIDFARLTVYRRSGENWFMNPYPANRD